MRALIDSKPWEAIGEHIFGAAPVDAREGYGD